METKSYLCHVKLECVGPLALTRKIEGWGKTEAEREIQRLPSFGGGDRYYPGPTLGGLLRNKAVDAVQRQMAEEEFDKFAQIEAAEAQMLREGVDITGKVAKENLDGEFDALEELRAANPVLGLFGRWRMGKLISFGNLHPLENGAHFVEQGGFRTDRFKLEPQKHKTLTQTGVADLKELMMQDGLQALDSKEVKAEIKKVQSELKTASAAEKPAMFSRINELEQKLKDMKKKQRFPTESIARPLPGYEAFKPGALLESRIRLFQVTDLELGIFLAALREFSETAQLGPRFGGGCGEVKMQLAVESRSQGVTQSLGDVHVGLWEFGIDGERAKPLHDALSLFDKSFANCAKDSDIDLTRYLAKP
ncbi:hypothetical protein [Ferrimonas marina]|uniref:Uncharacterized protein n=1 Tax=Ferrimonas marina TaxID=299255 RepID=A0A1M5TY32_9GAMM|nr:hypothetical protein [Ferrimonas marina]SHH55745.1 hypothetical protein SAMN02745129_2329 [Ferrimonas marina]